VALHLETQVQGCTLVGSRYGALLNDDGSDQLAILDSRDTLARLLAFIGSDAALALEYRWAPDGAPAAQ
jgi:hypothetical protein